MELSKLLSPGQTDEGEGDCHRASLGLPSLTAHSWVPKGQKYTDEAHSQPRWFAWSSFLPQP